MDRMEQANLISNLDNMHSVIVVFVKKYPRSNSGGVVEIGRIHIASLSELHPLLSQPQSSGSHSVFDLEFDSFTFGKYLYIT